MKELRYSLLLLLSFLIAILGVSLIQYVERNFIDFEAAFFVLFAIAAVTGLLNPRRFLSNLYIYLFFWAGVYGLVWLTLWVNENLTSQVLVIQFILLEISAGLSYFVGYNFGKVESMLDNFSDHAYPNRVLDFAGAGERINVEIRRSRRFKRSLMVLVVNLDKVRRNKDWSEVKGIQRELLMRIALAKVGQIISDIARQTDVVIRDKDGQFIVICPETNFEKMVPLTKRICQAIEDEMGGVVQWGSAAFPDEALSFDELLEIAEQRLSGFIANSLITESKVSAENN